MEEVVALGFPQLPTVVGRLGNCAGEPLSQWNAVEDNRNVAACVAAVLDLD